MTNLRFGYIGLLLLAISTWGFSQSPQEASNSDQTSHPAAQSAAARSDSEPAPEVHTQRRLLRAPCWRQAGMTPDMVNQRWKIEDDQKTRIAEVCSEPSTSARQKHDKIEQIHVDTDQAIARLIPAKELQTFNQCQAELEKSKPHPTGQKELGPCGGIIPPDAMSNDEDHSQHH